jgi:hypothetical protein
MLVKANFWPLIAGGILPRCIDLDGDITARVSLPAPPWWMEVTVEQRPEFQRRFDEF